MGNIVERETELRKQLPYEFYVKALEILMDYIDWGVQITDSKGYTIYYNEESSRIDGIPKEEAIGKHILEMFPSLSEKDSTILTVLKTGKPILKQEQEVINYYGHKILLFTNTLPIIVDGKIVGAIDISKDVSEMKNLITKVITLQEEIRVNRRKRTSQSERAKYTFNDIIGKSPAIQVLKEKAMKVAKTDSPILVYGETGTGKELLVHSIHNASFRRDGPFIAQNCAALPENLMESILFGTVKGSFTGAENRLGLVELADGGTLFLDELTTLSFDLQAKLLRFLEDGYVRRIGDDKVRRVDVRVICATNIRPEEALEKKLLRPDLYYRIGVITLCIPPLRERKSDIPLLVKHFIKQFNEQFGKNIKGITDEVEKTLSSLSWPGNVRELKGVIEYAVNFCDGEVIELKDLPDYILRNAFVTKEREVNLNNLEIEEDLRSFLAKIEYELIRKALKKTEGNISKAAKILGIPRQTLQYKMKMLNIEIE